MLSYTSSVTVAIDATPLSVPTGGVVRYTSALARALAQRFPGDEYWLLSDQPFPRPDAAPGNLRCGDGPRTPAERSWWLWGLRREMSRRGAQLFHGTDFSVPYLPLQPSVMTLHDLSPWLDPAWQPTAGRVRRRTRILLRAGLCTMVITPSEAVRRAAIERFRLDPDRVVAVPLAAAENFRPVAAAPAARPYFLFVGTLEPRKNITRLIESWRALRKTQDVELVIAGRARAGFAPIAPEPGLRVLGAVSEEELPALYSGALACVYPSLYEGFGLPALEAMQCGAVVIASRDPAIMEVTGDAAVHVDVADARALTGALEAASGFGALREKAIARAQQFSWRRTAERTREVYDEARRVFRN
jgi:glycosyltransferase involved in cell wall biosynthesis